METKAQLEKWLKQLKDNPGMESANPNVARRLVNHGLGACDKIARLQAQLEYHRRARNNRATQKELNDLLAAIERSGLGVSSCRKCGATVVCMPDGLPMCDTCADEDA